MGKDDIIATHGDDLQAGPHPVRTRRELNADQRAVDHRHPRVRLLMNASVLDDFTGFCVGMRGISAHRRKPRVSRRSGARAGRDPHGRGEARRRRHSHALGADHILSRHRKAGERPEGFALCASAREMGFRLREAPRQCTALGHGA